MRSHVENMVVFIRSEVSRGSSSTSSLTRVVLVAELEVVTEFCVCFLCRVVVVLAGEVCRDVFGVVLDGVVEGLDDAVDVVDSDAEEEEDPVNT